MQRDQHDDSNLLPAANVCMALMVDCCLNSSRNHHMSSRCVAQGRPPMRLPVRKHYDPPSLFPEFGQQPLNVENLFCIYVPPPILHLLSQG